MHSSPFLFEVKLVFKFRYQPSIVADRMLMTIFGDVLVDFVTRCQKLGMS